MKKIYIITIMLFTMFISMYSDIKVFKFINYLLIDELKIEKEINEWSYINKAEIQNTSMVIMKDTFLFVIVVYKKKG